MGRWEFVHITQCWGFVTNGSNHNQVHMHMRKKSVNRCAATFKIGIDEITWVSSRYKYLGCVIDEFL